MAYTAFTTGKEAAKALPTVAGFKFYITFDTPIAKEDLRIAKDRAFQILENAEAGWQYQVVVLNGEKKVKITEARKR